MRVCVRLILLTALLLLGGCTLAETDHTPATTEQSVESRALFDVAAEWIALALEIAGTGVIVVGGLIATIVFVRRLIARDPFGAAYHQYRANLGRGILLGLEFLVGADIIGTVAIEPTFTNLGVLALIVLIRTFLSFSLEVEIDGHWPWRDSDYRNRQQPQQEEKL
jgi:uncharacterized membrane protein